MNTHESIGRQLRLLQLADSGLPIGGLAHSFGLESVIEEQMLERAQLFSYLREMLQESLLLEAVFCRKGHADAPSDVEALREINAQLSAWRAARESREASLSLGKRFLDLALALDESPVLEQATQVGAMHYSVAFGFVCGVLSFGADEAVAAFLHQNVAATVSAAQRLLSLGQRQSSQIAWDLKPAIAEAVRRSESLDIGGVSAFSHLPELASMRHPYLETRLFIS
jgi:urease accessory protein